MKIALLILLLLLAARMIVVVRRRRLNQALLATKNSKYEPSLVVVIQAVRNDKVRLDFTIEHDELVGLKTELLRWTGIEGISECSRYRLIYNVSQGFSARVIRDEMNSHLNALGVVSQVKE